MASSPGASGAGSPAESPAEFPRARSPGVWAPVLLQAASQAGWAEAWAPATGSPGGCLGGLPAWPPAPRPPRTSLPLPSTWPSPSRVPFPPRPWGAGSPRAPPASAGSPPGGRGGRAAPTQSPIPSRSPEARRRGPAAWAGAGGPLRGSGGAPPATGWRGLTGRRWRSGGRLGGLAQTPGPRRRRPSRRCPQSPPATRPPRPCRRGTTSSSPSRCGSSPWPQPRRRQGAWPVQRTSPPDPVGCGDENLLLCPCPAHLPPPRPRALW
mmetsp:Transcript_49118/g.157352  ORF Transcript_49118/g.157352 Transcript_49118/m.157352 type:complete len:266 (+) Transcript_49118:293-1090(+)